MISLIASKHFLEFTFKVKCVDSFSEEGMLTFPTMVATIVYAGTRPKALPSWKEDLVPTPDGVRSVHNQNDWLMRRKMSPETFVQIILGRGSSSSWGLPTARPPPRVAPPRSNFSDDDVGSTQWGQKPDYASKFPVQPQNSAKQIPGREQASVHQRLGWMASENTGFSSQSKLLLTNASFRHHPTHLGFSKN